MTQADPKHFELYYSITGETERFYTAQEAWEAFFRANATERPSVIHGNHRSARTIARTMIIGQEIVKSLPFETDPEFTQAYLNLRAKTHTP